MANYRRKKVVYIEANDSGDINRLKSSVPFLKDTIGEDSFIIQDIVFLDKMDQYNHRFLISDADYIIKDMGIINDVMPEEYMMADRRILIGDLCAWKKEQFVNIIKTSNFEKGGWVLLTRSAYLDDIKDVYRETGCRVHPMPYISNPFQLKRQELNELEDFA